MCVYGMTQQDEEGVALVKRPTAFMTNAPRVAERLSQRCKVGHRHIAFMGGRAKRAEICPEQMCREILSGLIDQMKSDGRIVGNGCLSSIAAYEDGTGDYKEWMQQFWDDITGKELDPGLVRQAREEQMVEFNKHKVYTKVPLAECWDRTGKKPIGVRWVDK